MDSDRQKILGRVLPALRDIMTWGEEGTIDKTGGSKVGNGITRMTETMGGFFELVVALLSTVGGRDKGWGKKKIGGRQKYGSKELATYKHRALRSFFPCCFLPSGLFPLCPICVDAEIAIITSVAAFAYVRH